MEDLTHPSITNNPQHVKNRISIYKDAYSATTGTHAIVVCTEWDEFIVSNNQGRNDFQSIFLLTVPLCFFRSWILNKFILA